jgi:hypothetical protein
VVRVSGYAVVYSCGGGGHSSRYKMRQQRRKKEAKKREKEAKLREKERREQERADALRYENYP